MPVNYGGTSLTLMDDSMKLNTAGTSSLGTIGSGGIQAVGIIANTGISVWANQALAATQRQMQTDLANYNNSMRTILQGMKQFSADKNRAEAGDQHVNSDMQIELDRMRAEAQITNQAAFTGASTSAKRAALFEIDRNALAAKFNSTAKFENALQQIQLSEYSDQVGDLQQQQFAPANTGLTNGQAIAGAALGLANLSAKSGAWDKGGSLRTSFANLFGTSEAKLPTT